MINELYINNAILDLSFKDYIYEYTVTVNEDIDSLDFTYDICSECNVEIYNNNLPDSNKVYLFVNNNEEEQVYTFNLNYEDNEEVLGIDEYFNKLEIDKEEPNTLGIELLSIGVFLLIVIVFTLLFKHKK